MNISMKSLLDILCAMTLYNFFSSMSFEFVNPINNPRIRSNKNTKSKRSRMVSCED